VIFY